MTFDQLVLSFTLNYSDQPLKIEPMIFLLCLKGGSNIQVLKKIFISTFQRETSGQYFAVLAFLSCEKCMNVIVWSYVGMLKSCSRSNERSRVELLEYFLLCFRQWLQLKMVPPPTPRTFCASGNGLGSSDFYRMVPTNSKIVLRCL